MLIAAGADPAYADDEGWTGLMLAAQNGHADVCEILVERGANRRAKTRDGYTAAWESNFGRLTPSQPNSLVDFYTGIRRSWPAPRTATPTSPRYYWTASIRLRGRRDG